MTARDRLDWQRQMAFDCELSHVAYRVAGIIGGHFDNRTGTCFPGLERIARVAGVSRRTAWGAVEELARRGRLRVTKGGGRARANTYEMVLTNGAMGCTVSSPNGATGCTVSNPETVQNSARLPPINGATGCTPTQVSKFNSKAGSGSMFEENKEAASKSAAVFKVHSEQWTTWRSYHEATGNHQRASLMTYQAERSRHGTWQEPTEWPPSHQTNGARGEKAVADEGSQESLIHDGERDGATGKTTAGIRRSIGV
jgi:hypothetical protein